VIVSVLVKKTRTCSWSSCVHFQINFRTIVY